MTLSPDQVDIGRESWAKITAGIPASIFADGEGKRFRQRIDRGLRKAFAEQGELDPYRIEEWLPDASKALDRCLGYEREYHQLRVQAATALAEAEFFYSHADASFALEDDADAVAVRNGERAAQVAAKQAFDGQGGLADGFRALAAGAIGAVDAALTRENNRRISVSGKWNAHREYWNAMLGRYTEPGGAMNFDERANIILGLLENEIGDLSPKLFAIEIGAKHLFGIDDLPFPRGDATIAKAVLWLRQNIGRIEKFTRDQTVMSIAIPLKRTKTGRASALVTEGWDEAMKDDGSGKLRFNLGGYFPGWMSNIRLRAAGVSYWSNEAPDGGAGSNVPQHVYRASSQLPIVVVAPPQPNPYTDNDKDKIERVPVLLDAHFQPSDTAMPSNMSKAPGFVNIDPTIGDWNILVSKGRLNQNDNVMARTASAFADIYLHLTIAVDIDTGTLDSFSL